MATGLQLLKQATSAADDSSHSRLQVDANGVLQLVNSSGTARPVGEFYLFQQLADVSTASSAWVAAPEAGTMTKLKTIISAAITAADSNVTYEINGVAVTGIAITVANAGSAAGDVDTDTATGANTVAENDKMELITDGASSTTSILVGTTTIERRA